MKLRLNLMGLLAIAFILIASGCAGPAATTEEALTLAPESTLPEFAKDAPPQVKEAYRFAIANPDVLSAFPCYCGCGAVDHHNNLDCYIKEINSDGTIEFENHAFG